MKATKRCRIGLLVGLVGHFEGLGKLKRFLSNLFV